MPPRSITRIGHTRSMEEYFASCFVTTKIPMAYVIRKRLAPQPTPVGGWATPQAAMIARASIVVDANAALPRYLFAFKADNKALWLKIAAMTRDKSPLDLRPAAPEDLGRSKGLLDTTFPLGTKQCESNGCASYRLRRGRAKALDMSLHTWTSTQS
jgi:hypothetical protein